MTEGQTDSEDDLRRIVEVLQNQVESMKGELDDVKTSMKTKEPAEPDQEPGARGPEPKTEPEPEPETREEVIEYMKKLPGIGLSKANALYEEGFDSTEKLKTATAEDLIKVKGIGPSQANSLTESIEKLEAGTLETQAASTEGEEPLDAPGGGPMGFIKGTASKIFGFFKGKKPEAEPESGARGPEPEPEPEGEVKEGEEPVQVTEGESPEDEKKDEKEIEEKLEEEKPTEEKQEEEKTIEDKPTEEKTKEEKPTEEKTEPVVGEPEPEVGVEIGRGEPSGLEEPVEITSDAPPVLTMEETIQVYQDLPGIGESTASRLYEAGYETIDELKDAEEDDLKFIEGISDRTAEAIVKALKSM